MIYLFITYIQSPGIYLILSCIATIYILLSLFLCDFLVFI